MIHVKIQTYQKVCNILYVEINSRVHVPKPNGSGPSAPVRIGLDITEEVRRKSRIDSGEDQKIFKKSRVHTNRINVLLR